jgi:hypothetical protein
VLLFSSGGFYSGFILAYWLASSLLFLVVHSRKETKKGERKKEKDFEGQSFFILLQNVLISEISFIIVPFPMFLIKAKEVENGLMLCS